MSATADRSTLEPDATASSGRRNQRIQTHILSEKIAAKIQSATPLQTRMWRRSGAIAASNAPSDSEKKRVASSMTTQSHSNLSVMDLAVKARSLQGARCSRRWIRWSTTTRMPLNGSQGQSRRRIDVPAPWQPLTDQQFDRLMELQNVNGWSVDQDMEALGREYARIPKGLG